MIFEAAGPLRRGRIDIDVTYYLKQEIGLKVFVFDLGRAVDMWVFFLWNSFLESRF